ncbi:MAG: hypothetical protein E7290_02715 [Lachnospiraceae bacterium]|nr:hypothetical protein [Lachnospiraceae bacterium]
MNKRKQLSDSVKTVGKRIIMFNLMVVVIGLICTFLNFLYVDGGANTWPRVVMHNFYEQDKNIDTLFLGSSHVFWNINPYILDELTGENNFNLATNGQRVSASYYLLREADKVNDIKQVFVELYYDFAVEDGENAHTECITQWYCLDNMKWSANKIRYMYNVIEQTQYLETLLPFMRYRSKLFDNEHIQKQIRVKLTNDYKEYKGEEKHERGKISYTDKGYTYSDIYADEWQCALKTEFRMEDHPLSEESKLYIKKIIEYCADNNIRLAFFSAPLYELQMMALGDYDLYVKQIKELLAPYNIDYFDFNLVKEEYLSIDDIKYFADYEHLNSDGAEIFTNCINKIFFDEMVYSEEYFHDTYTDKLQKSTGKVFGIYYIEDLENGKEKWVVASNRRDEMQYRIYMTPDSGETVMLQDFNSNPYIEIDKNENGILSIVYRTVGDEERISTKEVYY